MNEEALKKIYWRLPYGLRRFLFMAKHPKKYLLFRRLRTEEPQKLNSPTFKPFIENKCIFIHIPKAAGISIGYSIFGRHTGNHTTIAEYQIVFSSEEFESFFKFTFVRNPWDRLLSAFLFLKEGGRNKSDYRWAEEHLSPFKSFDDFVVEWINRRNINKGIHFKPQYEFITIPQGLKLEVDFVGFFENVNNDYEYIQNKLRIGKKLILENKTHGKRSDYRSYYSDRMIEIVSDVYSEDIEFFGYDFENTSLEKQLTYRCTCPKFCCSLNSAGES
jgi:hypothetical protein